MVAGLKLWGPPPLSHNIQCYLTCASACALEYKLKHSTHHFHVAFSLILLTERTTTKSERNLRFNCKWKNILKWNRKYFNKKWNRKYFNKKWNRKILTRNEIENILTNEIENILTRNEIENILTKNKIEKFNKKWNRKYFNKKWDRKYFKMK